MSAPPTRRRMSAASSVASPSRPRLNMLSPMTSRSSHLDTPGSYRSSASSYHPSNLSHSLSLAPLPNRLKSRSSASSVAPSTATAATTQPGGPSRFKRGHQRRKQNPLIAQNASTMNPDELDLMALEDPDEVFRLFGVRDIRGLEKRASDAAAAKVAELRTMVGERYRDLLSAADSIIRMKLAADKLVGHLDKVESGITVDPTHSDSPIKTRPSKIQRASFSSTPAERSLASPATLSLTIQLLLSIPSLVDTLLESRSFLSAGRLEHVAQIVYQELSSYAGTEYQPEDLEQDEQVGLKTAFPIVARQSETVAGLKTLIASRARKELTAWDSPTPETAETLAAILMLENLSISQSLEILLWARQNSLDQILQQAPIETTKSKQQVEELLQTLDRLLRLILQTVETAQQIFGTSGQENLKTNLVQLLDRVNESNTPNPIPVAAASGAGTYAPILTSLPNFPLLSRHLPQKILHPHNTKFSQSSDPVDPNQIQTRIDAWLSQQIQASVVVVTGWIAHLKGGAKSLALVRESIRTRLPANHPLLHQLESAIETRLCAVYENQLDQLVLRVRPCLKNLLDSLANSDSDLDSAQFLFRDPLPFPDAFFHSNNPKLAAAPFQKFVEAVTKRVQGRSPVLDRAVSEFEAHAKDLKSDLQNWIGQHEGEGEAQNSAQKLLRGAYLNAAVRTLERVATEIEAELNENEAEVEKSLAMGNFAFQLRQSETFIKDLLVMSPNGSTDTENDVTCSWTARLAELERASLKIWEIETIEKVHENWRNGWTQKFAESHNAILWAGDVHKSNSYSQSAVSDSSSLPIPSQPTDSTLTGLRQLVAAVRRVGLHRIQSNSDIVQNLAHGLLAQILFVAEQFVEILKPIETPRRRKLLAIQTNWDLKFLQKLFAGNQAQQFGQLQSELIKIIDAPDVAAAIDDATLNFLQRTQTVFGVLFTSSTTSKDTPNWLPFGAPAVSQDFQGITGLVKPGPRLGLLPTRG